MAWMRGALLAVVTFSRIPLPRVRWEDDARGLAIAFLPLVGGIIGGAVWGWSRLSDWAGFGGVLFAAVAAALPMLVTGGIHMDGYCDTVDALASQQSRARSLEILKDPHVGAFAVMRMGVYLLLSFGLLCELYTRQWLAGLAFVYPLARCLAAWSALTLPNARGGGMLAALTRAADRRGVCILLSLFTLLSAAGLCHAALPGGIAALVLSLPVTLWYRRMTRRRFGGVTGDTTGFYLQTMELTLLAGLVAGGALWQGFC